MTYYEELGLSTGASEEEIRKSYRALSRMLHPDTQPEVAMRKLAEAQMKRLNEVISTLCDDERRAKYDLNLGPQKEHAYCFENSVWSHHAMWAVLAGIICLLGYGLFSLLPTEPEALKLVTEVGPLILSSPNGGSSFKGAKPIEPVLMIASARAARKVDGTWLYTRDPRDNPAKWTYSVESVELKLQEQHRGISGAFRSRFKIPDKALRPDLAFSFFGPANGKEFEWTAGRLHGQIRLNQQQDNVMEVNWKIIDEGSVAGLAAGSATLLRRMD